MKTNFGVGGNCPKLLSSFESAFFPRSAKCRSSISLREVFLFRADQILLASARASECVCVYVCACVRARARARACVCV